LGLGFSQQGVGVAEGIVILRQEDAALKVDDGIRNLADDTLKKSHAGSTRGIVGGTEHAARGAVRIAVGGVEVLNDFALVPDVIAGGEHGDVEVEKLVNDGGREAESAGG